MNEIDKISLAPGIMDAFSLGGGRIRVNSIDAIGAVGRVLPSSLRETGEGGLAAAPTGRRIAEGR